MAVQGLSQQAMTQVQKVHSATAVNILSVGGQGVKHNLHITPIAVGDVGQPKEMTFNMHRARFCTAERSAQKP